MQNDKRAGVSYLQVAGLLIVQCWRLASGWAVVAELMLACPCQHLSSHIWPVLKATSWFKDEHEEAKEMM